MCLWLCFPPSNDHSCVRLQLPHLCFHPLWDELQCTSATEGGMLLSFQFSGLRVVCFGTQHSWLQFLLGSDASSRRVRGSEFWEGEGRWPGSMTIFCVEMATTKPQLSHLYILSLQLSLGSAQCMQTTRQECLFHLSAPQGCREGTPEPDSSLLRPTVNSGLCLWDLSLLLSLPFSPVHSDSPTLRCFILSTCCKFKWRDQGVFSCHHASGITSL